MLSAAENLRLTQTGPDTPAGAVMRQFWQPAALTAELEGERPVRQVNLLGEKLVLYAMENGGYGLLDQYCPHRGADLCFGRLEDNGLRCPFHGWLFDETGQCLEQPAEPEGSKFYKKIKQTAYPCRERNGIIFAYMGEGEPPALPNFDCFAAPDTHTFAFKGLIECNWLQALEVGIDPSHASFLHRFLQDEDPEEGYGKQFRDNAADTDMPITKVLREYPRPEINVEVTDYGLRLISLRNLDNAGMHVRVTNQIFPHAIHIPMSNEMTITQWHVPVDDVTCYWYAIFTSFGEPVDKNLMREQREQLYEMPDYKPRLNKTNNYGYSPKEQNEKTYTGMGLDINVHDQWAIESPGALQDRTREHLGAADIGITSYRKLLKKAISDGEDGKLSDFVLSKDHAQKITGPIAVDAVAPVDDWQSSWRDSDKTRRQNCSWA